MATDLPREGTHRFGLPPVRRFSNCVSPREGQIVRLVGEGYMPEEIAARLGMAIKTVEFHTFKLRQKLGISSMRELRRACIRLNQAELRAEIERLKAGAE